MPVGKARTFNPQQKTSKKRKVQHVVGYGEDDTPKAFQRLMQFSKSGVKRSNGLDDGAAKPKKTKAKKQGATTGADKDATTTTNTALQQSNTSSTQSQTQTQGAPQNNNHNKPPPPNPADLKIRPGESMSEFRSRVDQALPLTGISRSGKKIDGISTHRVTKHERRLKRLQAGWREEEARIREKEQEALELAEEEMDEHAAIWGEDKDSSTEKSGKKNGKKGKKKRKLVVGEVKSTSDDDEWEKLQKSKQQRKGLHDVVSAPPTFDKVPREIFKVKNGAGAKVGNVPVAVGSLAKREQLGEERKTIIDTYRELMAQKRKA